LPGGTDGTPVRGRAETPRAAGRHRGRGVPVAADQTAQTPGTGTERLLAQVLRGGVQVVQRPGPDTVQQAPGVQAENVIIVDAGRRR